MTKPTYLIQGDNIIIVANGRSFNVNRGSHVNYDAVIQAIKDEAWDDILTLVDIRASVARFTHGHIEVHDDRLTYQGQPVHGALVDRIFNMMESGMPILAMVRFLENLMKNPSRRSIDQLYGFLEKNRLPITEDGYFLAYKKVRKDFRDIHSGSIDNSVGQVISMPRENVNDDPDSTCAAGLHFCSESYLGSFGAATDPIMVMKINPADVVSIPSDYNGAKGRCCHYEVIGEVTGDIENLYKFATVTKPVDPVKDDEPEVWPFPTQPAGPTAVAVKTSPVKKAAVKKASSKKDTYRLVRRKDGVTVETGLSLNEATAKRIRAVANKKASLNVVKE